MAAKKAKCNRGHLLSGDNLICNQHGRQCKTCHRLTQKVYRKTLKGVWTAKRTLIRAAGWTLERYQTLLSSQGGACAVCKTLFKENPSCDHDHVRMTPRGLLCNSCNLGLGKFKENPALLEAAAIYLRNYDSN